MYIFRLLGDLSHVVAVITLLLKIWTTGSCAGISGKSQILFAIVYITRYLDLLTTYISAYNTFMKFMFISGSLATVFLIYVKFKATYDHNHDSFRIEFLIAPALVLALLINHEFTPIEILWAFSIYLESVAILPQLFLVSKTGEAESIMSYYLFALGSYRGLYVLNWIYRYYVEDHYDLIVIVAGVVETVLSTATMTMTIIFSQRTEIKKNVLEKSEIKNENIKNVLLGNEIEKEKIDKESLAIGIFPEKIFFIESMIQAELCKSPK